MTIKEYLNINEEFFIISNEHLFIRHHMGEELVMTLHNRKIVTNPNIPTQNTSLANYFKLPITTDYNNTLTLNNQIVYQEIYELIDYYLPFGLKYEHVLRVQLHPIPTNELEQMLHDGRLDLIIREILLFKISLTEYLTDSLIPTGNIIDMSRIPIILNNNDNS